MRNVASPRIISLTPRKFSEFGKYAHPSPQGEGPGVRQNFTKYLSLPG